MKVNELMTRGAHTCTPNDSLHDVARLMWEHDCGCAPVVDADGKLVAMITDRDICMAAYTQGLPLARIKVATAASHGIVAVRENDPLDAAEALMTMHKVRRVPIIDTAGRPVGVLSMNDLALHAKANGGRKNDGLSADSIVRTLAAVCEHPAHA